MAQQITCPRTRGLPGAPGRCPCGGEPASTCRRRDACRGRIYNAGTGSVPMKLYTRTGDAGETSLQGGQRVQKADPRVTAYGTVDELNTVLGWAAVCADPALAERLHLVQSELFCIGTDLATPAELPAAQAKVPPVNGEHVARFERWIDEAMEALPPLRNFIVPGG